MNPNSLEHRVKNGFNLASYIYLLGFPERWTIFSRELRGTQTRGFLQIARGYPSITESER
jgi:hypothetical protein